MNGEDPIYVIEGGAGPMEAAAISAAITEVLSQEAAAAAVPVRPPSQSRWVTSWRSQNVETPVLSRDFDAAPRQPQRPPTPPD